MLQVYRLYVLQAGLENGQLQDVGCVIVELQIIRVLRVNESFTLLHIHLQGEFDVFFVDIQSFEYIAHRTVVLSHHAQKKMFRGHAGA